MLKIQSLKQSITSQQEASETESVNINLSVFTKQSYKSNSQQQQSTSKTEDRQTKIVQNSSIFNASKYSFLQSIIFVSSIFSSFTTIILTRNFYLLESLFQMNLQNISSVLQMAKLYSYTMIFGILVVFGFGKLDILQILREKIELWMRKSLIQFVIFIIGCAFLYYQFKQAQAKILSSRKIRSKIHHYIVWYLIGQISTFFWGIGGHISGVRGLNTYGETLKCASCVMMVSSLVSAWLCLDWDLFDMIGFE